jgi:tetratricopeptide (TPR) repeat protein
VADKDGDLAAAARAYEEASAADPAEPEYPYRLSQVLNRQGKSTEAKKWAVEHARRSQARSEIRKAWNEFADAFEASPPKLTPDLLLGMARASESAGWPREAAAWYREALRVSPDDTEARAGLERLSPSRRPAKS